jgi:hypothetical protein
LGGGSLCSREFAAHREALGVTEAALSQPYAALLRACGECLMGGGKLLFFGNGGSAAAAQHLATELTVRFRRNRRAMAFSEVPGSWLLVYGGSGVRNFSGFGVSSTELPL